MAKLCPSVQSKLSVVSEPEQALCRICFQPEVTGTPMLMDACSCKGSVSTVHEHCLVKWL